MAQANKATLVQDAGSIDHTPASAVSAGDVVVIGDRVAIARTDIAANRQGSLSDCGVYDVVKKNGAISDGDDIYWDADGDPEGGTAGTGACSTDPSVGPLMGTAVKAALAADEKVRVRFQGDAQPERLSNEIADPGDAAAVPVTHSGSVSFVTAGAETRTIAAPTFVGQQLSLGFKTDGGDCVVTVSTAVNQTGNNTLTFADAGDHLQLTAVRSGANLRWRVVANDGVALSTV